LSPTNQVLLVHRVKTSSAFASAHVFPGGNLSEFHDGAVPPAEDLARHQDGRPYRLGAVRETFEETGVLLARSSGGGLLSLPAAERDAARKRIYANEISFEEWLKTVGGEADLGEYPMLSIDTMSQRTNYWLLRKPTTLHTVDHTTSYAKEIYYPNVSLHASTIWLGSILTRCIRHRRGSQPVRSSSSNPRRHRDHNVRV
jgi:8-oxo-dGTP pyrophosphatase MutT (NUDIX family)